jgi:hypothetical protein
MLKRLVIFAAFVTVAPLVCISVSQNVPPDTPKKGVVEGNGTVKTQPSPASQHEDQNSAKAPSVVVQVQTPNTESNHADAHEDEAAKELARYTFGLMVLTLGLVVVGVIHASHLHKLGKAATDNAKAALLNAQVVINAERALILFTIEKTLLTNRPGHAVFLINARNFGKTPAREVSISEPKEIFTSFPERLPNYPEYAPLKESLQYLVPSESHLVADFFPAKDGWAGKQAETAREEKGDPASVQRLIYGEVRYKDGISDETRTSRYCFRFEHHPTTIIGGQLVRCGPPNYNYIN